MKKINSFFYKIIFFIFLTFAVNAENKILEIGNSSAEITVKVFSSLTCPHCADFHKNIFESLKKEYIDKDLVRFEHHSFPLDLAALNAEIIIRCIADVNKKFQLLGEIYKKQNQWAVGSDINLINESIKKIGLNFGLSNIKMDNCLKNESVQDQILNERIEAQKKYKIQSTPTIYINEKKYKGEHKYKTFKKTIEKLL
ncbi:DsbA family protein [Pelagibacterales bacterium SAG-MED05]|nr:DsbA family protein [Pelagibacterales bacterium SAG-MED05]